MSSNWHSAAKGHCLCNWDMPAILLLLCVPGLITAWCIPLVLLKQLWSFIGTRDPWVILRCLASGGSGDGACSSTSNRSSLESETEESGSKQWGRAHWQGGQGHQYIKRGIHTPAPRHFPAEFIISVQLLFNTWGLLCNLFFHSRQNTQCML